MARKKDNGTEGYSGLVGGIVMVQRDGKGYIRSRPLFKTSSWSAKQVQVRERFRKIAAFSARYSKQVIVPIWNLAPGKGSGHNRFIKANSVAFDMYGEIADLSMLHFSDGILRLPFDLHVVKDLLNNTQLNVNWRNDGVTNPDALTDELMMMAATEKGFEGPVDTGIVRSEQAGAITLPESYGEVKAVYLFLASADRGSYSPDKYFGLS